MKKWKLLIASAAAVAVFGGAASAAVTFQVIGTALATYNLGFGELVGLDINYSHMTIARVPEPAGCIVLPALRMRRRNLG